MVQPLASVFARWGTPPEPVTWGERAEEFLTGTLGEPQPRPAVQLDSISLPTPALAEPARGALAAAVGEAHVESGREARLRHLGGCSLIDYVRRRDGGALAAPDAVVSPAGHDQVVAVLRACSEHSVAVVPFGGGTSVVGGVEPLRGQQTAVIALSLDRMSDVLDIDEESCLVTVGPGITGPVLERQLQARGLTWSHLPQSWERASVGGYLATRSSGQASTGYGRSEETVQRLRVATPTGSLELGRGPASAAGPDLRELFLGSEGVLGVITEATLRVRHLPRYQRYEGVIFPSFQAGVDAFRELAQAGLNAQVMRLSDEDETASTLALSGPSGAVASVLSRYLGMRGVHEGALAILGWEGSSERAMRERRSVARNLLRRYGAVSLGDGVGRSWRSHRFSGPYLRDELLDRGYIVETLETATSWRGLQDLRSGVREALSAALTTPEGRRPFVMAHVSHVYETGASLYFTVLCSAEDDREAQWHRAKQAAGDAIVSRGATITHHHAVGTDHAGWLEREIGTTGVEIIRAVKQQLDPAGILNPGKLLG